MSNCEIEMLSEVMTTKIQSVRVEVFMKEPQEVDLLEVRNRLLDFISSLEDREITDKGFGCVGFTLNGTQYDFDGDDG